MATTRRAFIFASAATLAATTAAGVPVALASSSGEARIRELVRVHQEANQEHDLAYEA